ncbi:MAG TPA: OsmC family protein [Dongiaceae bacterium]|jgi:putative redox protein|nr:OsmC family protein [Dongiaceae bacterium]
MKARIKWVEGRVFTGTSNSGHGVVIAAPEAPGAKTIAPSPMEYVLLGTGGCTATDVVMILERGRQDVRAVEVELDSDRAPEDPKVFTRIHFHFKVTGKGLKPDTVERAIRLSHEKYCSASIMMAKAGAALSHDFEIIEAE